MSKIPYHLDSYDGVENSQKEVARFVVLYGKTSTRKNKIWEGDGILICYSDFCVLKTDNEKDVICKSSALKRIDDLENGRIVVLGSWSIEIQERVEIKNFIMQPKEESTNSNQIEPPKKRAPNYLTNSLYNFPLTLKNKSPISTSKRGFVSPMLNSDGEVTTEKAPLFVLNEREVIEKKSLPICVEPRFARVLREHQKQGIRFIFEKLKDSSNGVILADDMGLGKSIQTMAATWALIRGCKNGKNISSSCLIVVPSSLVNNWKAEFNKWWRNMLFPAVILQKSSDIDSFKTTKKSHPYLIISYDMALRYVEKLKEINFDILVCDEGHKLKNKNGKLRKALCSLEIKKRLILTGTPMQNDYDEFYSLLDFVRPTKFGTLSEFLKLCSDEPNTLNKMIDDCMLRRTSDINKSHLPEKFEYILFCEASEIQKKVHEDICDNMTGDPLSLIFFARQLCNHPKLMYDNLMEKHKNGDTRHSGLLLSFPDKYKPKGGIQESGKLAAFLDMLKCFRMLNECAVVVSNYIETLDMIEQLCTYLEFCVFRLDGKTNVADRQKLVKQFNNSHNSQNVFLLSTKAGGVGLNLIGASRLVLFDSDWNPANDQQAMARIWRDGQVRECHIYRLITTGTIEEKMLQRQIKKTGLGCVIDVMEIGEKISTFSNDELSDIFTFNPETNCNTHDLCECKCNGTGLLENEMDSDDEDDDEDDNDIDDEELEEDESFEINKNFEESAKVDNSEIKKEEEKIDDDDEQGKASLAELSRWRHFSPEHKENWKHFMIKAGLSQMDTNVKLTFAFSLTSKF